VASTLPVMPPLRSTMLPGRSKQTEHWVVAPSCNRIAATIVAPVLPAAQRKAVAQNTVASFDPKLFSRPTAILPNW
jgi:hypothetical protein